MTESGVAVAISADSSAFMRGMDQAKAIARAASKDIQSAIASIKMPPTPDIGKSIGIQKQQVFKANAEILADTKATVQKLKAVLEEEAAAYRKAHQARTLPSPEINRQQMSGSRPDWSHLEGTQFQGGRRGAGSSGAGGGRSGAGMYGFGVGYNAIQDLVQGGPMAVANNVPQIIDLVSKSPALKMLGAAAFAAAAVYFSGKIIKDAYDNTGDRQLETAGNRYEMNRLAAEGRARKRDFEKGKSDAAAQGAAAGEAGLADSANNQRGESKAAAMARILSEAGGMSAEGRRAEINAIADPIQRAQALAAEQKRLIQQKYADDKAASDQQMKFAGEEWEAAGRRLDQIKEELKLMEGKSLRQDEIIRKTRLLAELPAAESRMNAARAKAQDAFDNKELTGARESTLLPLELKNAEEQATRDLAKAEEQQRQERIDGEKAFTDTYLRFLEMRKEADKRLAEDQKQQAKQKAALLEQLEIGEAQAGGNTRKAERLQKEKSLRENTEKYKSAGFSDKEAADMARREQRMDDRRSNPRRIRGAGADGPAPERASALDYFDGKSMGKPSTSKLDDYERRRSIPGVGGTVDKELEQRKADEMKKAADAAKAPKGDERTHALLQQLLEAFKGLGGNAAPEPASPAA